MSKKNNKLYSWLKEISDDFNKGFLLLSKYTTSDNWMFLGCYDEQKDVIDAMREEAVELEDIEYLVYEINEVLRVSELNSNANECNPVPLFFGVECNATVKRTYCVREWEF